MKTRVAVLGSCYTRELFNSKFVPNWHDDYVVTMSMFQNCMPCLMSKPIPFSRRYLRKGHKLWGSYLYRECMKDALNILAGNPPDVVLIDFWSDARGANRVNGYSFLNYNFERWQKENEYFVDSLILDPISSEERFEELLQLTKESFRKFMEFKRRFLPNCVVVINEKLPSIELNDNGNIVVLEKYREECEHKKRFLREMHSFVCDEFKEVEHLVYNKEYKLRESIIVHFEQDYYIDAYEKFKSICCKSQMSEYSLNYNNLIINSDFRFGTLFWRLWNSYFRINNKTVEFENFDKKNRWNYLECNEIEVSGVRTCVTISFEYKNLMDNDDRDIFLIRTYPKRYMWGKNYVVDRKMIMSSEFSSVSKDGFLKYVYSFYPSAPIIVCGPYGTTGKGIWRNIMVNVGEYNGYKESLVENYILEAEDCLVDVNNYSYTLVPKNVYDVICTMNNHNTEPDID